jgi:hypothetical protein
MSEQVRPKFTFRDLLGYLLAYWFWILGAAISMLAVFMIRQMVNVMWPALGGNRWVMRAIDRFGLVFLGLVWLVYAIFTEQFFRTAITQVRERRHKARVNPSPNPPPEPKTAFMKHLKKIGLDILAQRLLYAIGIPLLILGAAWGLFRLSFIILDLRV